MDDIVGRSAKATPAALSAASVASSQHRRPPPQAVQCLLPVWGDNFVRQFLEIGLPTLLAPGNLPALARALPTRFCILTWTDDEDFIRHHPAFRRLSDICPTEVRPIDHLITASNYSTTITLAYTEAVRAAGDRMLDTCFFFLVSDYIVADGSFASVIERMQDGRSAVLVGNFQVVLEDALPWLQEQIGTSAGALAIAPRKLLQWALNFLHPATVASTVNIPLSHNTHPNRLFWQVDGDTLLGRFYLMHMICVRPETADFVIGSSCDYSFVPEMCPSNNVEVITDSDDYLVIEMQPALHEARFLRPGPLGIKGLARHMSSWTTARHRENSQFSVVFHAKGIPPTWATAVAQADQFIARLQANITRAPKPHRDHPYWRGAIAAHREATGMKLALDDWRRALGLPDADSGEGWASDWLVEKLRFALFGQPPRVRLWHPRWPDYRFVVSWLSGFLSDHRTRLLLAANAPTVFTASLADSGERVVRIIPSRFLADPAEIWEPLAASFDLCLVELGEEDIARIGDLLDRLAPMIKDGGAILVVIYNARHRNAAGFAEKIDLNARLMVRRAATLTAIHIVAATRLRWALARTMTSLGRMAHQKPMIGIPVLALAGGPLALASLLANAATLMRIRSRQRQPRIATSFAVALRVDGAAAKSVQDFSAHRILRKRQRHRLGPSSDPDRAWHWRPGQPPGMTDRSAALPPPAEIADADAPLPGGTAQPSNTADFTREPQYARLLELKSRHGVASLGLMTNQVWHDDPRRMAFLLARYKFVAKMLSGRGLVAEVGCGDAFGARIVQQECDRVDVYDFDPVFIEDVRRRQSQRWPLPAAVHDIVLAPLARRYDAIYSLDLIEHIDRGDEHAYLANLRDSLDGEGVLIIGTPSLESQHYASPQSKAGHVNCKSGVEFKALMQRYFVNVFLFSMNDEVVHTGFYPMAHYLIAVCTGKR